MLQVYKILHPVKKLEEAHENSYRGETLSLPPVWPGFHRVWGSEKTPEDPQWRDVLLLLQVYKVLLPVRQLKDSHENPHQRETLSLSPV